MAGVFRLILAADHATRIPIWVVVVVSLLLSAMTVAVFVTIRRAVARRESAR